MKKDDISLSVLHNCTVRWKGGNGENQNFRLLEIFSSQNEKIFTYTTNNIVVNKKCQLRLC